MAYRAPMEVPRPPGGNMPVDLAVAFQALCESRALRWELGEWDWIGDAVDPLQHWAEANGLVRLIGQDSVQAIMAEAFTEPAHNPPADELVPTSCPQCHPGPCRFPTFCSIVEDANKWWATIPANHPLRRGTPHAR